ncbi:serine/threonine protein kinase [Kamptonema formosum]|uniref:serine/threonine protein kinase n=1 Tax=Kamptonema formosum TaxID=331992 RepID=UPI00034DBE8A|nr:serine/threonine-protein kinase [Oscillatoria sp. PCC 10802]
MLQIQQLLQGRYQLQKSLGYSAGRQTWLALELSENPPKPAIVKLLAFSPEMQWDEFKLFEREAQVLQNLDHPRIPKYRDYFSIDKDAGEGLCWFGLVQDFIAGKSLQQMLDEGYRFTETQVRSIATQVLDILIQLHGLNPPVLHRDIKPSNLLLGADEQVYLVDFGAVSDPTAVEGATFTVVGTAGYAPLEQFWGKAVPASDLYALGATLIHLLTGISPSDLPQSNLRIQFQDRVSLDARFCRWIESLTEPDLNCRFSSAAQALEALKTGASLQKSRQPASSRIRLKKSPNKLVIKISKRGISLSDIPHLLSMLRSVKGLIIMFWPCLPLFIILGDQILRYSFLNIWDIQQYILVGEHSVSGSCYLIIFILLIIMFCLNLFVLNWSGFTAAVLGSLKSAAIACFGSHYLGMDRYKFLLEKRLFIWAYSCSGSTSEIQTINLIPSDGSVRLETKMKTYCFGEELTNPEAEWLVEEIQDWLYSGLRAKD